MKDYRYIEELLEAYFKAETTIQEEQILRSFFQSEDIPPHLMMYQPLFAVHERMREECAPKSLVNMHCNKKTYRIVNLRPFYRAAASVAIVLCIGMAAGMSMGVGNDSKAPTAEALENPDAEYGEMEQVLTSHSSASTEKKDTLFLY